MFEKLSSHFSLGTLYLYVGGNSMGHSFISLSVLFFCLSPCSSSFSTSSR